MRIRFIFPFALLMTLQVNASQQTAKKEQKKENKTAVKASAKQEKQNTKKNAAQKSTSTTTATSTPAAEADSKNKEKSAEENQKPAIKKKATASETDSMTPEEQEKLKKKKELELLDKIALAHKLPPLSKIDSSVTKEQVDLMVYKKVSEAAIPKFPEDKYRKAAEAKYPLWKVGDTIKTIDAQGYKHEGEVKVMNTRYVRIGDRAIYAVDFSGEMLPHLNKENRQKAIDKYINEKKKIYLVNKRSIKAEVRTKARMELYGKYGFVFFRDKWLDYEKYHALLLKAKQRMDKIEKLRKAREAVATPEQPEK